MSKIPLIDIDGTLLKAGSKTHLKAYAYAVNQVFGVPITAVNIDIHSMQGMTDSGVLVSLAMQYHVPRDSAIDKLPELIKRTTFYFAENYDTPCDRFPGVMHLLQMLRRAQISIGILTGNIESIARMRITKSGLGEIIGGGFGDFSINRADLVLAAQKSMSTYLNREVAIDEFVIIGDTIRDFECAQVHGIPAILVVNGSERKEELEATGAAMVIDSFETASFVRNFLIA